MKKIDSEYLKQIQPGDIIAKYPIEGDKKDSFNVDDKDKCYVYSVLKIFFDEVELGVSVLGDYSYTFKLRKRFNELTDGFWWCEIDTAIFSD